MQERGYDCGVLCAAVNSRSASEGEVKAMEGVEGGVAGSIREGICKLYPDRLDTGRSEVFLPLELFGSSAT